MSWRADLPVLQMSSVTLVLLLEKIPMTTNSSIQHAYVRIKTNKQKGTKKKPPYNNKNKIMKKKK